MEVGAVASDMLSVSLPRAFGRADGAVYLVEKVVALLFVNCTGMEQVKGFPGDVLFRRRIYLVEPKKLFCCRPNGFQLFF